MLKGVLQSVKVFNSVVQLLWLVVELPESGQSWEVHHLKLILSASPLDDTAMVWGEQKIKQELPHFSFICKMWHGYIHTAGLLVYSLSTYW